MKVEAEIVGGADADETAAIMAAVEQYMRDMISASQAPKRPDLPRTSLEWRAAHGANGANENGGGREWGRGWSPDD